MVGSYSRKVSIPSLSENALLRYFSFTALYFAQGISQGLLWYSLPAWFAMNGKTPMQIGSFIAVIGLPWSLKIFVAPFIDRFSYLCMGRRKPWLLFGQAGLVVGLIILSLVNEPLQNLSLLMVIGFALSCFSIFQDIAIDGMAVDLLPQKQQARANGLMWGAKAIGISATVAATGFMIVNRGYFWTIFTLAGVVSLVMLVPLVLKERSCEKRFPWSPGKVSPEALYLNTKDWNSVVKSVLQVTFLPASILMGLTAFVFAIGRGLIDAVLPVFTVQELGWSDVHYSSVFSTTTMISGLLAMGVAGVMIDFFGKKRMFTIFVFTLLLIVGSMAVFSFYWTNSSFVSGFFILFYTLDTFVTIAIFAIAMQLCWKRVAATQFTIYMAISNLGLSFGAWLMGQLKQYMTWELIFLFYAGLMVIALTLIYFLNLMRHTQQVDLLMDYYFDERIRKKALSRVSGRSA